MRTDWVPLSASALVIGAMALVFGSVLNPAEAGSSTSQTLRIVSEDSGRWLAMSVMYFLASVTLTLGLPALLTLFERRGRRLGLAGVGLFAVGAIGTCGFAMLMIFLRAMVVSGAIKSARLETATHDAGLAVFLQGWIIGFYGGVLLIAVALFVSRSAPRWVPALMLAFVLVLPVSSQLGRVGMALQVLALAVAFTGIAMAAVTGDHQRALTREPAF